MITIDKKLLDLVNNAEKKLSDSFKEIEEIEFKNQLKVLKLNTARVLYQNLFR